MAQTNLVFIVTFLIIALGYCLKRLNIITEKEGKVISKFMMHTTFPALMLVSTMNTKINFSLISISIFTLLLGLGTTFLGWFVFKNYPPNLRGLFLMGFGATNVGLFGYPIVQNLFGAESLSYMVMYDIGNSILGFGVAYPIGQYFSKSGSNIDWKLIFKRVFTLPPFVGMIVGLTLANLNITLPETIINFLNTLAKGNTPIGLLLLGIYLSFNLEKSQIVGLGKVLFIRYFMAFIALGFLYYFLPATNLRNVMMLSFLLPLGLMIIPFSDEMKYNTSIAGTLVNISLLISFVLMWLLMLLVH
jgi:malate permease and related proteins